MVLSTILASTVSMNVCLERSKKMPFPDFVKKIVEAFIISILIALVTTIFVGSMLQNTVYAFIGYILYILGKENKNG